MHIVSSRIARLGAGATFKSSVLLLTFWPTFCNKLGKLGLAANEKKVISKFSSNELSNVNQSGNRGSYVLHSIANYILFIFS